METQPVSFHTSSYLSQVRRLRKLAEQALKLYPVKDPAIFFINHGENATFRIESRSGKFLLRLHRSNYHSKPNLLEELNWLNKLSKIPYLEAPRPIRSKQGRLLEFVSSESVSGERACDLFHWIDGKFIDKSLKPSQMFELGRLIALLHNSTENVKTNRRYWTSEGLVGKSPTFGPIDQIKVASKSQQARLIKARNMVFKKLQKFEKEHPSRMGLIHADLHFGNIIDTPSGLSPIDFDDCGFGFYAYDFVPPLISAQHSFHKKKEKIPELKEALIEGYSTERSWDHHDDKILHYLMAARNVAMLGWLNSRSDNPRLKKHLKVSIKGRLKYFKVNFGI